MSAWPAVRLDECAQIISGATPKTSNDEYWGGRVPWATPKDLSELGGPYISDTPRKLTDSGLRSCAATVLPPQSVLFSSRAPIGLVAVNTIPMATNQGFKSFVPKRDRLDPKFLYHWLRAKRAYLEALGNGATFKEVSKAVVSRVEIPLPPLSEQRRIAAILDQADALRAKRRAALAKLDELTQSIFLDMFGDPATNPKGWRQSSLGSLLTMPPNFGTMIPPVAEKGAWLSLRVANIQNWQLDLSDRKFVDLPQNATQRHSVRDGDLLLARAIATQAHLGKAIVAYPDTQKWAFDSHLVRLRFNPEKAEPEFIRQLLRTSGGRKLFLKATRRSAVQFNINTKEISALRIPVPALSLQRSFASLAAQVRDLKAKSDMGVGSLDALFASLQHRAFSGSLLLA